MKTTPTARSVAVLTVGVGIALAFQAPTFADDGGPPTSAIPTEAVSQALVVSGFDADVARANGFTIGTNPDGSQYSEGPEGTKDLGLEVPSMQPSGGMQLRDTRVSSCGSSWVYLYDDGVRRYLVQTGFTTVTSAVGYTWTVRVTAPTAGYLHDHQWHGVLALNHGFRMETRADIRTGSWTTAKASGSVLLVDGGVCHSLGPIDSAAVY